MRIRKLGQVVGVWHRTARGRVLRHSPEGPDRSRRGCWYPLWCVPMEVTRRTGDPHATSSTPQGPPSKAEDPPPPPQVPPPPSRVPPLPGRGPVGAGGGRRPGGGGRARPGGGGRVGAARGTPPARGAAATSAHRAPAW